MVLFEYCAIGLGPSNLSLGALASTAGVDGVHVERDADFRWHPGMLIDDATVQVHMLKDLVSAVEPTNPLSFANFLVEKGRFYEHLNAGFDRVLRAEYEQYLIWAAAKIENVHFGAPVSDVKFEQGRFLSTAGEREWASEHLVLGVGQVPLIPAWAEHSSSRAVVHSSHFSDVAKDDLGEVAVVGGGQSGAEIVLHLATRSNPPARIHWITRRDALYPLDESSFANDLFAPPALQEFYDLPPEKRRKRLEEQRYASDGINADLLRDIYQYMYGHRHLAGAGPRVSVALSCEATQLTTRADDRLQLDVDERGSVSKVVVDTLILATGYRQEFPSFLGGLRDQIATDEVGRIRLRRDFSAIWDGSERNQIFIQNGASHAFGIAEPNLSLIPYRSRMIIERIKELR